MRIRHLRSRASLLEHKAWFAYALVSRDAPWWVKAYKIRGVYWIWGGTAHWVYVSDL